MPELLNLQPFNFTTKIQTKLQATWRERKQLILQNFLQAMTLNRGFGQYGKEQNKIHPQESETNLQCEHISIGMLRSFPWKKLLCFNWVYMHSIQKSFITVSKTHYYRLAKLHMKKYSEAKSGISLQQGSPNIFVRGPNKLSHNSLRARHKLLIQNKWTSKHEHCFIINVLLLKRTLKLLLWF